MPTILFIEEDDDTRPLMKRSLERMGYHVVVALEETDAVERVSSRRLQPDLILLNIVGVSVDAALDSARRVRRAAELDNRTPLIVLADEYGEELEGHDVQVSENEYVTYLEDHEQLARLLERLLPLSES
jgi:CheY-like chemotaxis protein